MIKLFSSFDVKFEIVTLILWQSILIYCAKHRYQISTLILEITLLEIEKNKALIFLLVDVF